MQGTSCHAFQLRLTMIRRTTTRDCQMTSVQESSLPAIMCRRQPARSLAAYAVTVANEMLPLNGGTLECGDQPTSAIMLTLGRLSSRSLAGRIVLDIPATCAFILRKPRCMSYSPRLRQENCFLSHVFSSLAQGIPPDC